MFKLLHWLKELFSQQETRNFMTTVRFVLLLSPALTCCRLCEQMTLRKRRMGSTGGHLERNSTQIAHHNGKCHDIGGVVVKFLCDLV